VTSEPVVEVNYALEGPEDAPVLVLSNSLGSTLEMWDDQASVLRERFRLVRYDQRGHGGSPVPSGPYKIEDLGLDLLALLDRLEIERVSFCGLSIGGLVGMWLASEDPDRVERLVLCCTAARFDPDMYDARARKVRAEGVRSISDVALERWFTPEFRASRPETLEWAESMLRGTPTEGYAGCCEVLRDADVRDRLKAIRAPTLVIAGAEDPAATVEQAEEIRDSIPGARLAVIENAAHLANIEQPEAVTREILDHLEPVAGEGR
jgi:3-oxoadipate enol-lactonase